MQKLNYSWNKITLSLWFCFSFAHVTFPQYVWRVFSVTTTAAAALCLGGWTGSLCWWHLQGCLPPLEKTSHKNKQDASLRCPFESLQSENVTSKATFPTEQGLLCCGATKRASTELDSCSCHPVSHSATSGILKCGGCSAWQQLCKKWGAAAQVFHKTIWRKSTKNRCERASCISAKLSIKKLVSMQCLICHKNCFK